MADTLQPKTDNPTLSAALEALEAARVELRRLEGVFCRQSADALIGERISRFPAGVSLERVDDLLYPWKVTHTGELPIRYRDLYSALDAILEGRGRE